jgi:hypothetical protein
MATKGHGVVASRTTTIHGTRASAVIAAAVVAAMIAVSLVTSDAVADESDPDPTLEVTLTFEDDPSHAELGEGIVAPIRSEPFAPTSPPVSVDLDVQAGGALHDAAAAAYAAALVERTDLDLADAEAAVAEAFVGDAVDAAAVAAIDVTTFEVVLDLDRDLTDGAELDGGTGSTTGPGSVDFPTLSIDRSGRSFTLAASTDASVTVTLPAITVTVELDGESETVDLDDVELDLHGDATSDPSRAFSVFDDVGRCDGTSCSVRSARGDRFTIGIDADATTGFLALSISGEDLSDEGLCGGVPYQGLPDAVHFDSVGVDAAKRATILID